MRFYKATNALQKVFRYIRLSNSCWLWQGSKAAGYAYFKNPDTGKTCRVHRWLYEKFISKIKKGFVLDHLCCNKSCVKPSHLEVVTQKENMRRYYKRINPKHDTHCPKGHELIGNNAQYYKNYRRCGECNRQNVRRYSNV